MQDTLSKPPIPEANGRVSPRTWLYRQVRDTDFYWRFFANGKPRSAHRSHVPTLAGEEQAVFHRLRRDGLALTSVSQLAGAMPALFSELDAAVARLENEKASEIREAREKQGFKNFLLELLGPRPALDPESIFVRFALQPSLLNIANAYFGMFTRLRFFNVWRNFTAVSEPKNSQLWHRDPEDRFILKVFIYLSDVTDGAGPLSYAPGTHGYGRVRQQPESFKEDGTTAQRSTDAQMEKVVPRQDWVTAFGPKGTVVFADTRGYHKGGWVKKHERLLYNCMFTSQATDRAEYFTRSKSFEPPVNPAAAFALGC